MNPAVIEENGQTSTKTANGWHIAKLLKLNNGLSLWCALVFATQVLFAFYLCLLYAIPTLFGATDVLLQSGSIIGYKQSDGMGNAIFLSHVIPAALLSVSGTLQLVPGIRSRYRAFHRWNGRVFLLLGIAGAITGLYLTWGRGARLTDIGAIGITLNGLLIPIFAVLAWHFARAGQWLKHKRFAIHAFILINGVLSFRLFLMSWYFINQGPNGNTTELDGPADLALSFACYALPMAIFELCQYAERKKGWILSLATTSVWLMTALTLIGMLAAAAFMWAPKLMAIYA